MMYRYAQSLPNTTSSRSNYVLPIYYGSLDQSFTKIVVFADYCKKYNWSSEILEIIASCGDYIRTHYETKDIAHYLSYHTQLMNQLTQTMKWLGVDFLSIDKFATSSISWFTTGHQYLEDHHRLWERSDVVYYDIVSGTIVPSHYLMVTEILRPYYTIKFFLNATRDTVLAHIDHPYYLFACVALLIHPQDKRYKKLRHKEIILPIVNRQVPVIMHESVDISDHGTRLLIPWHRADDYTLCVELGLDTTLLAYDEYGIFTKNAKHFEGKSLVGFGDNVIKYVDDIANLEAIWEKTTIVYRNKDDKKILYPLLQKNIYMHLWNMDIEDYAKIYDIIGDDTYRDEVMKDESRCLSNKQTYNMVASGSYEYGISLIWDIVYTAYRLWCMRFPTQIDDIIALFDVMYGEQYFVDNLIEYCAASYTYDDYEQISQLIHDYHDAPYDVELQHNLIGQIDTISYLIYTKQWYAIAPAYTNLYHYDNEYVSLLHLLDQHKDNAQLMVYHHRDQVVVTKHYLYLHYYIQNRSCDWKICLINDEKIEWYNQTEIDYGVQRLLLLQSIRMTSQDEPVQYHTQSTIERFIQKWRNFCRIFPTYMGKSLHNHQQDIKQREDQLSDYEIYVVSILHELYEEVQYLHKHYEVDIIVEKVIDVLLYKIPDLMLFIYKKHHQGEVSDLVASYVILFANHILYPLLPVLVSWLLHHRWSQWESWFFQTNYPMFLNKNYKTNLFLHLISEWYAIIQIEDLQSFVLQANRDFINYFHEHIVVFQEFLGHDYEIEMIEEFEPWPSDIDQHKIFTLSWWCRWSLLDDTVVVAKEIVSTPSLTVLNGQLQYKQQLTQTIKNTIIRLRASWQHDKVSSFESQLAQLSQEISDLEYQISKIKYF